MKNTLPICEQFQTPQSVARYMVDQLVEHPKYFFDRVLEPTPGNGNIVQELKKSFMTDAIFAPEDYFLERDNYLKQKFDCVIMNPPFSKASCNLENAPDFWKEAKGMTVGYNFLYDAMEISDYVIALMPWFTIADSDVRMRKLIDFGLISVTLLPRKTFDYARIQTCVLHLQKDYTGETEFKYLRTI